MSHNSTPHLTNKRTPGRLASHTPGQVNSSQMNSTTFSEAVRPVLNSSRSVCDVLAASAKQLLNAYIYEFLIKNTLTQTAKCFVSEADVPSVPYDLSHLLTRTSPLLVGDNKDVTGSPQTPAHAVTQLLEDHNIPNLAVSMESPQGFLYEWWHVFWDIFQASNDRRALSVASQFHQMHMLKQKQCEMQNMDAILELTLMASLNQTQEHVEIPAHLQGPMPILQNSGPIPLQQISQPPQQQSQQMFDSRQRYMMQMMMKQQQHPQQHLQQRHHQGSQPNGPNTQVIQQLSGLLQPLTQGQRNMLNYPQQELMQGEQNPNGMALNGSMPQSLFIQHPDQARMQQQAQSQMNNLRQLVAAQQQPIQGMTYMAGESPMVSQRTNSRGRMVSQQGVQLQFPQQNMDGTLFVQHLVGQNLVGGSGANSNGIGNGDGNGNGNTPLYSNHPGSTPSCNNQSGHKNNNSNNNLSQNQSHHNSHNGNNISINSKVVAVSETNNASNNNTANGANGTNMTNVGAGNGLSNSCSVDLISSNSNTKATGTVSMAYMAQSMLPSSSTNALQDYQVQLMLLEKQNKKRLEKARLNGFSDSQMPSAGGQQPKISPIPSPIPKASPNPAAALAGKKGKRGLKQSVSSEGISPSTAETEGSGSSNGRTGAVKKECAVPPTPAAEGEPQKKKRKNNSELTKKATKPDVKKEKLTPKLKKAAISKSEPDAKESYKRGMESRMPTPGGSLYQPIGNEKMINVDILGSGSGEGMFFGTGASLNIDDVDFDFNLFLDSGDVGLNDSLTGFAWGDPIEGGE